MTQSMREIFTHHHRLSEAELSKLWETCSFVLDANVLLNIYRYADSTREDLFKVLSGLKGRVWVPYEAAQEFYRRRIEVIQEQHAKYEEVVEALGQSLRSLHHGGLRKSAFLRLDDLQVVIQPGIDEAQRRVKAQQESHPDLLLRDTYLEKLTEIIGTNIGVQTDTTVYEERCKEAQLRIDAERPPGYRDSKKPAPGRFGDVLIWFEQLDYATATKRPVIFVTDDDKEDWWQIVAGRKLGPRPELRDEMRKRAGVEFHIYNPAFLLETAGKELNLTVAKSSVDDAEKVAVEIQEQFRNYLVHSLEKASVPSTASSYSEQTRRVRELRSRAAEGAVLVSLENEFPDATIRAAGLGPFTWILEDGRGRLGVDIKLVTHSSSVRLRMRDSFVRAFYELSQGQATAFRLYLITFDEDSVPELLRAAFRGPPPEPAFPTVLGLVRDTGQLIEVHRELWGQLD